MNIFKIAHRCIREIRNSSSKAQLVTAYRYYRLFYELMIRKGTGHKIISKIDNYILKIYRHKRNKFEVL